MTDSILPPRRLAAALSLVLGVACALSSDGARRGGVR